MCRAGWKERKKQDNEASGELSVQDTTIGSRSPIIDREPENSVQSGSSTGKANEVKTKVASDVKATKPNKS